MMFGGIGAAVASVAASVATVTGMRSREEAAVSYPAVVDNCEFGYYDRSVIGIYVDTSSGRNLFISNNVFIQSEHQLREAHLAKLKSVSPAARRALAASKKKAKAA